MSHDPVSAPLDAVDVPAIAPKQQRLRVLAVLSALMGFASISTDLYLPAMPTMAKDLVANTGSMELTISGFLIGFSLGQLLWGPLGDRFGRRLPVAIGLLLFVIGSAGCALSDSAIHLIVWRVVQAVGALHYGSGIFGSAAVSALADGTPVPMALVVAASSFACLASLLLPPKRKA